MPAKRHPAARGRGGARAFARLPSLAAALLALGALLLGVAVLASRASRAEPTSPSSSSSASPLHAAPAAGGDSAGECPVMGACRSALSASQLPPELNASSSPPPLPPASSGGGSSAPCAVEVPTATSPIDAAEPCAALAELGRSAWRLIHSAASHVDTSLDLDRFVQFMHAFAAVYPCKLCKTHAWAHCGEMLTAAQLYGLHGAARRAGDDPRAAAQAWAARLHACVMRNNVADEQAVVSSESRALADAVTAAGDDDGAVVRAVRETRKRFQAQQAA
jgi:hypothetical protein